MRRTKQKGGVQNNQVRQTGGVVPEGALQMMRKGRRIDEVLGAVECQHKQVQRRRSHGRFLQARDLEDWRLGRGICGALRSERGSSVCCQLCQVVES